MAGRTRQTGYRAVFMRGGTSKAVIFREADLPADAHERHAIFLRLMGSPDPSRRQLDGIGGGVSSLSKVCIVEPSTREDIDVDYTFAQIPVVGTTVDYSANCGNMSSAIGPFAVEEGLVRPDGDEATVRIFNTNTKKIIVSRFSVADGLPVIEGDFENPGVAGSGSPIRLDFADPGGATTGRLLPTRSIVDVFEHDGLPGPVPVSIVDATNMVAFVPAGALDRTGRETPDELEADEALMARLDLIRRLASVAAGFASDLDAARRTEGNPKVALVAAPQEYVLSTKVKVARDETDILVRMLSMGQAHRAIPLTGALCTATAARISGTVVADVATLPASADEPIRIGHSSGILPAVADVAMEGNDWVASSAGVFRTARRLMEGVVYA